MATSSLLYSIKAYPRVFRKSLPETG